MAARRKAEGEDPEAQAEWHVEEAAEAAEAPAEDVEADAEAKVADAQPDVEPEADVEERIAAGHVSFMDGYQLVQYAPGDVIDAAHAERVTSEKALRQ